MSSSASLDILLRELATDSVAPEGYSRRSIYSRCEPLVLTTALAAIAVLGAMTLCELTR